MSSSSQPTADATREYQLIERLELRIASADTSEKLEGILQKFLAALVLKLASETDRNRNLTIKICQYINQRLKIDGTIKLPVQQLLKVLSEAQNAFVKHFCLLFIQQGLSRLSPDQGVEVLPGLLKSSIPERADSDRVAVQMWTACLSFLFDVLRYWKLPEHRSKEDAALKDGFNLSFSQTEALRSILTEFLLYDGKTMISRSTGDEMKAVFDKVFRLRAETAAPIARFLLTSIFNDEQRLLPAVVLSIDPNPQANSIGDTMFKQCEFDFESEKAVDTLFALYDNAKPKLQTRILNLLSRSRTSATRSAQILRIIDAQLTAQGGGLESAKLRAAMFSYLTWVVRVNPQLGDVSSRLQDVLRRFVEIQGWPTMAEQATADVELRAKAYESIGLLAGTKTLEGSSEDQTAILDLVTWLFTSLRCDTSRDIRGSIEEALSRIINVLVVTSHEDRQKLKTILLWNSRAQLGDEDPTYYLPTKYTTKYPAVRFANKCIPFSDVDARYIDLSALSTGERREVMEEANRGLDPYWHASNLRVAGSLTTEHSFEFPDFNQLCLRIFESDGSFANDEFLRDSSISAGAVMFCRNVLAAQAWAKSSFAISATEEWTGRIDSLLTNEIDARKAVRLYMHRVDPRAVVLLLEAALRGMSVGSINCAKMALELIALSPNAIIRDLNPQCIRWCDLATSMRDVQHYACRIAGILISLTSNAQDYVKAALESCLQWKTAVGQDALNIQGSILKAGFTLTRESLRQHTQVSNQLIEKMAQLLTEVILDSRDKTLKDAAYLLIGELSICVPTGTNLHLENEMLIEKMLTDAKKESEPAIRALGRFVGLNFDAQIAEQNSQLLDRLVALHEVRKAEFHFVMGEALAVAALGLRSSSTIADFDVDADLPVWGIHTDLFQLLIGKTTELCKTTKPALKKAAAIWLLSLIQFCEDAELIKPHLRDCQAAFTKLLNDRDEIVQETGSRGLSLVYEKGDKNLRDDLVKDLVSSFTGSTAKMSGTVNEETQLFEAGALPTEAGQSVTTYKDIVSLATEMGDPSLVYRFMNLASNNAIWSSRAAFGRFGLSGMLADSTYLKENRKFYPKLFRYRFDPNPNVQRSMDDIWKALVKDPNAVIEENFDLIMEDLLKSIVSGREWRAREASCSAIADLVQGKNIEKFEKYLDQIWQVAFKVLDDVKESVRVAAMKLCKTLTSMLIRNLEVGEGTAKRATTMLGHAMPFLLQQMDSGGAKEVQQYAIVTILDIVKKAPPRSLQAFAPTVLESFIVSLSSLEHESINYLHLNADKYGLTADKLDKMRVSSINASPVTEAIERCLESLVVPVAADKSVDAMDGVEPAISPMSDAMKRLEGTFKMAIGLPSRVGLSRVLITLVVRHHANFRPYADRFAQLVRKHVLDRNTTISISFSMALAYLMRLASEKEIQKTSDYAQKLYFESQELSHRAVAGEIVQSIAKVSNDVFMKFATTFLPFAFIGRNDLDTDVRERFDPPWKDNIGGSRALHLYLREITQLLLQHIKSSLWPIRHACCFAVANLITSMEVSSQYEESEARMLWPLMEEALGGKTWEGKEKVISAYPTFVKHARVLWTEKSKQMKLIALREAKRVNAVYRPYAISALGAFVEARQDLELQAEVLTVLTNTISELTDEDMMEVDDKQGGRSRTRSLTEDTVGTCVKCLFATLSVQSNSDVLDQAMELIKVAHGKHELTIDMAIYDGAGEFIMRTKQGRHDDEKGSTEAKAEPSVNSGTSIVTTVVPTTSTGNRSSATPTLLAPPQSLAAFSEQLILATLEADRLRHSSDNESLRKSRGLLVLALVEGSYAIVSPTIRSTLISLCQTWQATERSRLLRTDLDIALQIMLNTAVDAHP